MTNSELAKAAVVASTLAGAAKALAPIARAAWPKARRLVNERRAAQGMLGRDGDFLDKIFDETLDRLGGGGVDEAWWKRVCDSLGYAVVAPDFLRIVSVREWLGAQQVRADLKHLARSRLLANGSDDTEARSRLQSAYMDATGEAKRTAKHRVEVILGVLAAAFVGTVDRAQEPVVALIQAADREDRARHRETQAQLADVGTAVAALGPDSLVVQEHTRRAMAELSIVLKRRGVNPARAALEARALVEQTTRGDLRHADLKIRNEVLYWAARLNAASRDTLAEAKAYRDRLRQSGTSVDIRINRCIDLRG